MSDIEVEIQHNLPKRSFMPFKFTTSIPIQAVIHVCVYSNRQNVSSVIIFEIRGNYNTTTGLDLNSIVTNVEVRHYELEIENLSLEIILEGIDKYCGEEQNEPWSDIFIDFIEPIKEYYRNLCSLKRQRSDTN
jgi:hypothetical protein